MDQEIKLIFGNEKECAVLLLNKSKVVQKLSELIGIKEVESIEIKYKKEPVLCKGTSSKN